MPYLVIFVIYYVFFIAKWFILRNKPTMYLIIPSPSDQLKKPDDRVNTVEELERRQGYEKMSDRKENR